MSAYLLLVPSVFIVFSCCEIQFEYKSQAMINKMCVSEFLEGNVIRD